MNYSLNRKSVLDHSGQKPVQPAAWPETGGINCILPFLPALSNPARRSFLLSFPVFISFFAQILHHFLNPFRIHSNRDRQSQRLF